MQPIPRLQLCGARQVVRWGCQCLLLVTLLSHSLRASAADTVRILHINQDALQARVDLIQQAQTEINLSYFIVGDDDVPLLVMALVRHAARRGLTVRILVDGQDGDNQIPRAMQVHLQREGVQIREFRPPEYRNPELGSHRMHDKLFIVDQQHLITGGRNLKDDYYGRACENFIDRDVYIRGGTAGAAQRYYLNLWNSCDVQPADFCRPLSKSLAKEQRHYELNDPNDEAAITRAGTVLDEALATAEERGLAKLNTGHDWAADQRSVDRIRFLYDPPGIRKTGPGGIGDDMLQLLSEAQYSVVLQTPYFVISDDLKRVLANLRCRGVDVLLLTNSAQTNNHQTAHAGYLNQRRWLLRHGITIWELAGAEHLHAKAAWIDGRIAVIGSYNFDMLSERRNTEVAVAIDDENVAAELWASLELHLALCNKIGPHGKPIGYAVRHPNAAPEVLQEIRRKRWYVSAIKRFL